MKSINNVNRREFLSVAGAAAAALTLGLNGERTAVRAATESTTARRGRLGISDEAYAAARARAEGLSQQMTLKELVNQVADGAPAIDRLKLPKYNYYTSEALHGLMVSGQITSFPVPLALSCSWNPELALKVYTAVADECRAYDSAHHNGLSFYSPPTLNLHRDPRWGRCYEAPGEDPCLAGTFAVQVIRGMQGDDPNWLKTTPCSKHFICNNTDDDRESVSATVDPRSFWEYYTRAYRATVEHGDVFTFMSAYNAVNGIPCSADKTLLTDMLRGQWGFRGYVTSDCDAVKDICDPHHYAPDMATAAAMGIKAGCDLNCWGGTYQFNLPDAVDRGLVTQDEIREAVTRLLTVRTLLGTLDPPETTPYGAITMKSIDWKGHDELALESARQSLVLLKNDNDFLPLDASKIQKLAVIGPLAATCQLGGYSGGPNIQVSPLQAIYTKFGITQDFIAGGSAIDRTGSVTTETAASGAQQLAFIKDGDSACFENVDLTGKNEIRAMVSSAGAGGTIDLHLDKLTGPVIATFAVANTGSWDSYNEVSAPLSGVSGPHDIYVVFHGAGGGFLMNLERLTLYPQPASASGTKREVVYRVGCSVSSFPDDVSIQSAVDAAKSADVVILVCGIDGSVDHEALDRNDIVLTGAQPALIKAVYAANPKTVLVLSSNNTVSVVWEQENIPAILGAICAGQRQGTAIVEALFGDYNPGGKTSCTWYQSLSQLPPKHDYDIAKGRTYQYFTGDPLYPFGYGLSYTSFSIDDLQAAGTWLEPGKAATLSVRVTNTGKRSGAEVVQLYVTAPPSPVKRPLRQLAGFQRVVLKPGRSKRVVFDLPYESQPFWYWDVASSRFVCTPGDATAAIGNSSAHTPLTATLHVAAGTASPDHPDAVETVAAPCRIV